MYDNKVPKLIPIISIQGLPICVTQTLHYVKLTLVHAYIMFSILPWLFTSFAKTLFCFLFSLSSKLNQPARLFYNKIKKEN